LHGPPGQCTRVATSILCFDRVQAMGKRSASRRSSRAATIWVTLRCMSSPSKVCRSLHPFPSSN
jgi:hypothetical protein